MLRLPIILITIYKDKLYYKVKQYKDNSTNINSNRHLSINF
jgi:hypothetical protein